jgi:hypothetical protein
VAAIRLSLHYRLDNMRDFERFPEGVLAAVTPPAAYYAKLVVDAAHRFQGIATALDRFAVHMASQSEANAILAIVPPHRVPGLCKLGYKVLCRTHYPYTGDTPATIVWMDLRHQADSL